MVCLLATTISMRPVGNKTGHRTFGKKVHVAPIVGIKIRCETTNATNVDTRTAKATDSRPPTAAATAKPTDSAIRRIVFTIALRPGVPCETKIVLATCVTVSMAAATATMESGVTAANHFGPKKTYTIGSDSSDIPSKAGNAKKLRNCMTSA